jgi:hypothetical protein
LFEPPNGLVHLGGRSTADDHRNNRGVSEGKLECGCGHLDGEHIAYTAKALGSLDNIFRGVPIIELAVAAHMGNQDSRIECPSNDDTDLPLFTEGEQ